jgi:PKD repeat protein
VNVTNAGGGTLSALAVGDIQYGHKQPTGWLQAGLAGTTAPTTLTLGAATGTLAAGTYTATVQVSSSAAGVTNSPQVVAVTFVVGAGTAPPIPVSFTVSCVETTCTFAATSATTVTGYHWDFGDNTTGTGAKVVHTYGGGTRSYTVQVTATGAGGATGTATDTVTCTSGSKGVKTCG